MDERQQPDDQTTPEPELAEDLDVSAEQAEDVKGGGGLRRQVAAPTDGELL